MKITHQCLLGSPTRVAFIQAVVITLAGTLHVDAESATVMAHCRSFEVEDADGSHQVFGTVETWFNTYGVRSAGDNNGEIRPRSGASGVYEANYATWIPSEDETVLGSLTLNLPTTDADGNGFPDFLQKGMAGNANFSGSGSSDDGSTFSISQGRITRAAGSEQGNVTFRATDPWGTATYSTVMVLSHVSGSVDYERGASNTMDLSLSSTADGTMHGVTSFTVHSADSITIDSFNMIRTRDQRTFAVQAATLNRSGNKYIGNMQLEDGYLESPWADYDRWVLEVTDDNDGDGDGIPDLSDAMNLPPSVALTKPAEGDFFPELSNVGLEAEASDEDGSVVRVEFWNGDTLLFSDESAPYSYEWMNVPVGYHSVRAVAVDNAGSSGEAQEIVIAVFPDGVIYGAGFEEEEGYKAGFTLRGQNGWTTSSDGQVFQANGVYASEGSGFSGQVAYIGLSRPNEDREWFILWKPINYAPLVNQTPYVRFSVFFSLGDSTNGSRDVFGIYVYGADGSSLCGLKFDMESRAIHYALDDGSRTPVGRNFEPSNPYILELELDFGANRWRAKLDEEVLFDPRPITTQGASLEIKTVGFELDYAVPSSPGNNFLMFDEFLLATAEGPFFGSDVIKLGPVVLNEAGEVVLQIDTPMNDPLQVQATTDFQQWDTLGDFTLQDGKLRFTDPQAPGHKFRFYRAVK